MTVLPLTVRYVVEYSSYLDRDCNRAAGQASEEYIFDVWKIHLDTDWQLASNLEIWKPW